MLVPKLIPLLWMLKRLRARTWLFCSIWKQFFDPGSSSTAIKLERLWKVVWTVGIYQGTASVTAILSKPCWQQRNSLSLTNPVLFCRRDLFHSRLKLSSHIVWPATGDVESCLLHALYGWGKNSSLKCIFAILKKSLKYFKRFIIYLYVCICIFVAYKAYVYPWRSKEIVGLILWSWSCKWLNVSHLMCMPGSRLRPLGRAGSAFNHWAISPAPL